MAAARAHLRKKRLARHAVSGTNMGIVAETGTTPSSSPRPHVPDPARHAHHPDVGIEKLVPASRTEIFLPAAPARDRRAMNPLHFHADGRHPRRWPAVEFHSIHG